MRSGDGWIVRVRASVRPLTSEQLLALAELAHQHGNGLIEVTRRANLQLRGVREAALPALQAQLVERGLADPSPAHEKRLAPLMVSPLAFSDPQGGLLDALATSLSQLLLSAASPLDLPAKFGLILDTAGAALAAVPADLRVQLYPDGSLVQLRVAAHGGASHVLGACAVEHAPRAVLALLQALSEAQQQGHTRMRELVVQRGAAPLVERLEPWLVSPISTMGDPASLDAGRIGFGSEGADWLGLALPFGSGDVAAFRALAQLADDFGSGLLRTTAARTLIVPGVRRADRAAIRARARRHQLLIDPTDPLLRVVACAGAPACDRALGETRALASTLAASGLVRLGVTLHVSGCEKSCARSGAADITWLLAATGVRLGFDTDVAQTAALPVKSLETARQRLTAMATDVRVPPPMTRPYDYERDGAAIYRRSFAIIRKEAQLSRFSPLEERVAVRLVHTSGMVDLADDVVFSSTFAEVAAAAVRRGAPILCDANMIVSGVTRSRLSANNDVLCFLDHPSVPALAAAQRTTRSAAALSLWAERLDGAVVAIGNAPTALFRLLELLDETDARPAAVIGLPVGFVGAAESKEALLLDGRVPAMIVRGRRGGSAMTVAAINALASDKE